LIALLCPSNCSEGETVVQSLEGTAISKTQQYLINLF
jgi:hypothetical protein